MENSKCSMLNAQCIEQNWPETPPCQHSVPLMFPIPIRPDQIDYDHDDENKDEREDAHDEKWPTDREHSRAEPV